MTLEVRNGNRVALIYANEPDGPFSTRLYANCAGTEHSLWTATLCCKKAQTIKGARKQAEAMVRE